MSGVLRVVAINVTTHAHSQQKEEGLYLNPLIANLAHSITLSLFVLTFVARPRRVLFA